ncbi:AfsR/SARP family transcriptional regulator [Kutzneria sp. CA-103260]|uniref:AfsR/SARP family transcriptional regulator n=1 Tax=Kutzneria sp. CA-103260 TaxID=2802641 RepID=UPI001BA978DF|nr:BTAD domain-containing putative transcriptional regulator [Kutzneria sp. CA-103260]QUQ63250.1 SARP family transcriptional regulator [Kutzneria sp. CA-103260]
MRIRVLGPIDVASPGGSKPVGRKVFAVAAMLAVRLGDPVAVDELVDVVWADRPPVKWRENLYTYISALRRALRPEAIVRSGAGYRLSLDRGEVDVHAFNDLARDGRRLAAAGDHRAAADRFAAALALWRGDGLGGLDGSWARGRRQEFEELRLAVLEDRLAAELDAGDAPVALPELAAVADAHPTRERLQSLVVLAMHRAGRSDEALAYYDRVSGDLADRLGITPGAGLRAARDTVRASPSGGLPRPRQLPADLADFTGRSGELGRLAAWLERSDEEMPVGLITGRPGVGKSCLAVRAAHRASARFAGGQLYARVGDADPADVLAGFLRALGVPVPAEAEERARLYRSVLADRPVLVVLDDVVSERQVRPLLPGRPGSAVLVTSRSPLAGLYAARRLSVRPFDPPAGVELLARVAGPDRVRAEPESALEIVRLCGGSPLAVRIAGARLVARPLLRLVGLAERLREPESALAELVAGDLTVADGIDWSYGQVAAADRQALARLAAIGDTALTPTKVASLLGLRRFEAEDLMDRLADGHLLEAAASGGHIGHLVRVFLSGRRGHAVSA